MANAILARVRRWGQTSMCITVDPQLKREMGFVPKDVLAFRVFIVQGRRILVGEKVPMHMLASLKELPVDLLPKEVI